MPFNDYILFFENNVLGPKYILKALNFVRVIARITSFNVLGYHIHKSSVNGVEFILLFGFQLLPYQQSSRQIL